MFWLFIGRGRLQFYTNVEIGRLFCATSCDVEKQFPTDIKKLGGKMKHWKKKIAAVAACVLLVGTTAILSANRSNAYWEPGDDHKMHFPQLPDADGMDVWCAEGMPLADDFLCTESGPITDIHFWGSWYQDIAGVIHGFWIGIWSNNPGIPGEVPSHPEVLLWEQYVTEYHEIKQTRSLQSFYVPQEPIWFQENHVNWSQYNINITSDPFWQENGTVYWLSIRVNHTDGSWGWKNADLYSNYYPEPGVHYMDDAVWGVWDTTTGYDWMPGGGCTGNN